MTPEGEIALCDPAHPEAAPIPLPGILHDLDERGIAAPLLLRVSSFLEAEIKHLNQSFADAIARMNYKAPYRGVFPIKVNQQAQVIDRIVEFGKPYQYGLEAGSKPGLVIALAHRLSKEALIVCNGVKDAEFVRLAILSRRLGFNTVIVLESPKEAETVIEVISAEGAEVSSVASGLDALSNVAGADVFDEKMQQCLLEAGVVKVACTAIVTYDWDEDLNLRAVSLIASLSYNDLCVEEVVKQDGMTCLLSSLEAHAEKVRT